MLAHVRNGSVIQRYQPDAAGVYRGILRLEGGGTASPPQEGYENGNDKVLPVVEETQDTSTGPYKHRTDTGYQVEADRVYRLVTIRDKTSEEMTDEEKFPPLQPYQFWAAMEIANLSNAVKVAFENIEDATVRAVANARLNKATFYRRSDPLFVDMAAAVGVTQQEIDTIWMMAKDL